MPRPLREQVEGGFYHVFARGNRRCEIFRDEADYAHYLALLGGVVRAKRWRCLAYCLMPNHVHLLIETPEANIARGMQYLHGFYAHHFNARYDLSGHLFQGRYGSKLIRDDVQFLAVVRYTALNPVEGGLCAMPEDWPWSSYGRALDGDAPAWLDVDGLLTHFGPPDPSAGYVQLVSGGRREPA